MRATELQDLIDRVERALAEVEDSTKKVLVAVAAVKAQNRRRQRAV